MKAGCTGRELDRRASGNLPHATRVAASLDRFRRIATVEFVLQLAAAFLLYYVAGRLGQATTNIRSSNLGPVWPAYGIALAAFLAYGHRIWPAIALSAIVVAIEGGVSLLAATGQAIGATASVALSSWFLRRDKHFDAALSSLHDAIMLMTVGAFGGAVISSSVGIASLYTTGIQPYSGLGAAWFIYWLGDATGVLLVTPLVFTLPRLLAQSSRAGRLVELGTLFALTTAACFIIFGEPSVVPIRTDALGFAVVPFVIWGAIRFGAGGTAVCVFLIAALATVLTALGHGPFAENTTFINALLLDLLFAILAVTGLSLAAVISERERAESERERLVRAQAEVEGRLRLASIVESSNEGIVSQGVDGVIQSWNQAASRIFGHTETEAIGRHICDVIPPELCGDQATIVQQLRDGVRLMRFETAQSADAVTTHLVCTVSPLVDGNGQLVGMTRVIRDVTEQKRAEAVLSNVNRRLIGAQELERARIARELHDDIGQRLAMLAWKLAVHPEALQNEARDIASDIQSLSRELHPRRIDMLGIVTSIRVLCSEFAEQKKAHVDFQAKDVPSQLPSGISLGLYRVVQEALHNALKHSHVHHFEVGLWAKEGFVHVTVRDSGAGFDVETARRAGGIGLITMKERIKLVQGELTIESRPGQGTTVHAVVPFSPPPPRPDGVSARANR